MVLLAPLSFESRSAELRAASGDRSAWNELVARHGRRVLLSIVARGVPIDVAREIAQQAWLRLYELAKAGRLDLVELPGLAVRQAEFLLRDRRRGEARARGSFEESNEEVDRPEARLVARDTLRAIERVVIECPPGQQRIFWAACEQSQLSHSEIAVSLGISVQHLRQTLCDIRQKIRTALEDHHD